MKLLTPKEAAAILKVSDRTVQRLVSRGEIPAKRIGDQWRIIESTLIDWITNIPKIDLQSRKVKAIR